jgi:hypothetical protein
LDGIQALSHRIAVLMLALGFTLGVYREPIQERLLGVAQTFGLVNESSDAAYAAYQEGLYATALRLARPLANEGDARAQLVLGLLYYGGLGVPEDTAEALRWFRHAAGRGDPHYKVIVPIDGMSGNTLYPEQYTAWHLVNTERVMQQVTLTTVDLIGY